MRIKLANIKKFFLRYEVFLYLLIICVLSILAWYKILNFWFFKGIEASWFMGSPHDLVSLFRNHAHIYLLSFKLFGWNPTGWYLISLIFHTTASLLLFWFIYTLTSKLKLAFIIALLFVASITYQGVLTWGSFNAYYGLMMVWFLLATFFFYQYRQGKGRKYYFLSLIIAFLAFLTRETGLVLLGIIPAFDFLFFPWNKKEKKKIFSFIKRQLPFFVLALVFLIFRASYGGVSGDAADGRVQLRRKLISEHLFFSYFLRVGLTFGKHFAAEVFPYPFLNNFRDLVQGLVNRPVFKKLISFYLFPLIGWLILSLMIKLLWFFRKAKKYFPILAFSFVWAVFQTALYALIVPDTDGLLIGKYQWNTSRYHYYAFLGVCIFIGTGLYLFYSRLIKRFKKYEKKIFSFFIIGLVVVVGGNVYMIHSFEDYLAKVFYKPGRQFYTSLKSFYPTLPTHYLFYQYPHTVGLNDYLFEWYFLKEMFYPNLKDQPFRTEGQMERVLQRIEEGEHSLDEIFFFDYHPTAGLIDKTSEAKKIILGQKEFSSFGRFTLDIPVGLVPVEMPYQVEVRLRALPQTLNSFPLLTNYAKDRYNFLVSSDVSALATASQRPGEPFFHLLPANLINGNFGPRSFWIADSIPAVVTLDLGKVKELKAVLWSSQENSVRVPSSYSFHISIDGENWQKIKQIKKNKKSQKIDVFEKPVEARFVKMVIETTSGGTFALLDELEVIGFKAAEVLNFYQDDVKGLIQDSSEVSGLNFAWGKLSWETNKTPNEIYPQEFNFIYYPDGQYHTYILTIPEREIFSASGEFFKKFLTSIKLDFGKMNPHVNIDYLKFKPKYPL